MTYLVKGSTDRQVASESRSSRHAGKGGQRHREGGRAIMFISACRERWRRKGGLGCLLDDEVESATSLMIFLIHVY